MQNCQESFIPKQQQGRLPQALCPVAPSLPTIYLLAPVVTRSSSRRRAGAGREPARVLLGPFCSEVEARFIQTSAQALGLVVERTDSLPFTTGHGDPRLDRNNPTPIDAISDIGLALN